MNSFGGVIAACFKNDPIPHPTHDVLVSMLGRECSLQPSLEAKLGGETTSRQRLLSECPGFS